MIAKDNLEVSKQMHVLDGVNTEEWKSEELDMYRQKR